MSHCGRAVGNRDLWPLRSDRQGRGRVARLPDGVQAAKCRKDAFSDYVEAKRAVDGRSHRDEAGGGPLLDHRLILPASVASALVPRASASAGKCRK